jgi:hypothetical protein
MGLDMYAMRLTDDSKVNDLKPAGSFKAAGITVDSEEPFEIYYEWRKHPNLHQFFENIYWDQSEEAIAKTKAWNEKIDKQVEAIKDPTEALQTHAELVMEHGKVALENAFNSGEYVLITPTILDELEKRIREKDLPHGAGFFWGTSDLSEEEMEYDLGFITESRKRLDRGETLIYSSWW